MKALNLFFDPILPEEIANYTGTLIFTTQKESPKQCKKLLLHEDILEHHPIIIRGIMMQKLSHSFEEDDLILGVDPRKRMGLSVSYYGTEIERSVHTSIEQLVLHIIGILSGLRSKRKILKIVDGNMDIARQIVEMLNLKFCSSFELEFVDESRTSPKIKNFNQRGKRDMLSAKFISQREWYRHSILPLYGWLETISQISLLCRRSYFDVHNVKFMFLY